MEEAAAELSHRQQVSCSRGGDRIYCRQVVEVLKSKPVKKGITFCDVLGVRSALRTS